jgi:hypothetical protein
MKNKASVSTKKQSVTVKDLKTRKNPKGGSSINTSRSNIKHPGISDQAAGGVLSSY